MESKIIYEYCKYNQNCATQASSKFGTCKKDCEDYKELLKPCMIRLNPSLKETIEVAAEIYSDGNFNGEIRELIRIGLKNRKRGEKK